MIEEVRPFEKEVQDSEGTWWLLRIFPYRTQDNRIDGAVVALIDVDALKRAQGGLREALDYSSAIVETTHEPLLVLDSELRVVRANRAFREKFNLELRGDRGALHLRDGRTPVEHSRPARPAPPGRPPNAATSTTSASSTSSKDSAAAR